MKVSQAVDLYKEGQHLNPLLNAFIKKKDANTKG
jgi:hypothetical protein